MKGVEYLNIIQISANTVMFTKVLSVLFNLADGFIGSPNNKKW
jgi:hypothetical protein